MNYSVRSDRNRHFELLNGETVLGKLDYSGYLSTSVILTIGDDEFKLGPSDFWITSYHVVKNDEVYADLKLNWGGSQVVRVGSETYMFHPDFWNGKHTLINEQEQPVAVMVPDYDWSTLRFTYEIETDDLYAHANNVLLLLCLIYCCNHRKRLVATERV